MRHKTILLLGGSVTLSDVIGEEAAKKDSYEYCGVERSSNIWREFNVPVRNVRKMIYVLKIYFFKEFYSFEIF
jgi:hypothetical protein